MARLRQQPVSQVAVELGIAQSALHRWLRQPRSRGPARWSWAFWAGLITLKAAAVTEQTLIMVMVV